MKQKEKRRLDSFAFALGSVTLVIPDDRIKEQPSERN